MQRVLVIGCPGSGKSTFAGGLHAATGLPLFHLDMLFWNADRTVVEKSVFLSRLSNVLGGDAWIIDGHYPSTMEMRMAACDTVFFLDYPPSLCLAGIIERRGKERSDMPWIEEEEDPALTERVRAFPEEGRPALLSLFAAYPDKRIITFKSREEADAFLAALS